LLIGRTGAVALMRQVGRSAAAKRPTDHLP